MLIDWFTVSAQIVNFLILVCLLKRFLYKPILGAIDEREKRIAEQLAKAKDTELQAKEERETYEKKNSDLKIQSASLLSQAATEAKTEKEKLINQARKESDDLRVKQAETLKKNTANLHQEIIRKTQAEVFAIARKTLSDLASDKLEERIVDTFMQRLKNLSANDKKNLTSEGPGLVRSAFPLSPAQQTSIESAVTAVLANQTPIQFELAPELISGIELTIGGNKVAWSIADYLGSLEKTLSNTDMKIKSEGREQKSAS